MRAEQSFVDSIIDYHQHGVKFNKAMFASHLRILGALFKDFSDNNSDFSCLSRNDQELLLNRNTNLFISFVLAKYFCSDLGAEQFQWLFLLPDYPFELKATTFREFNGDYNVLQDPRKFQRTNGILAYIAGCDVSRKSAHMIAHACLFNPHPEDRYTNRAFIENIGGSLIGAFGWDREENDERMRDLSELAKLYGVMNWGEEGAVALAQTIDLPFTGQELKWIAMEASKVVDCFREVSLGEIYIKQMISCELFGVTLPKDFFLNFIGLWAQRFLVLMKGHQEFNLLTSAIQSKVWKSTILSLFAIVLVKFENAGDIEDQLSFALGRQDMATLRDLLRPWGDVPDLIPRIQFSRSNKTARIASDKTQSRAEEIKREVVDFVTDSEVFYNTFLYMLFEDAREFLGNGHDLMRVSDRYLLALRRQVKTRLGFGEERFNRGMGSIRAYVNLIKYVFASPEETVAKPPVLQGVTAIAASSSPPTSQAMVIVNS